MAWHLLDRGRSEDARAVPSRVARTSGRRRPVQAIASSRTMLPEGALRTSAVGRVELSDTFEVSSASALLESALVEASRLQSEDRLAALTPVIDRLSTGSTTGISLGLGGGSETTLCRPADGQSLAAVGHDSAVRGVLDAYRDTGVTTPAVSPIPGLDANATLRAAAPGSTRRATQPAGR